MCLNRAHLPETLFHTNFKLFCVKGWNASKKERMPYIRLDKVGTKTVVQARLFQIFFFFRYAQTPNFTSPFPWFREFRTNDVIF